MTTETGIEEQPDYADYCTCAPDLNFGATCCKQHDEDYDNPAISRKEADAKLRVCIRARGYLVLPWVYWFCVRVFGRNRYILNRLPQVK